MEVQNVPFMKVSHIPQVNLYLFKSNMVEHDVNHFISWEYLETISKQLNHYFTKNTYNIMGTVHE